MSNDVADHVRSLLVRYLVQRAIFCPYTGSVLDVRTCVVIVDRDGDPCAVISQEAWATITARDGAVERLAEHGLSVDPATVQTEGGES